MLNSSRKSEINLGNVEDELTKLGVQASVFLEPISDGFGEGSKG